MLLGTAAADENCCALLCKADILLSLIELLKGTVITALSWMWLQSKFSHLSLKIAILISGI